MYPLSQPGKKIRLTILFIYSNFVAITILLGNEYHYETSGILSFSFIYILLKTIKTIKMILFNLRKSWKTFFNLTSDRPVVDLGHSLYVASSS